MARDTVWTLAQAARLLQERQHRLIYLCEKRVVVPDFGDAAGRGSSRRFSARNLLEFAIALRLKPLGLPAGTTAAILHTLRSFEKRLGSTNAGLDLLHVLRHPDSPGLRAIVADGERLYFLLGEGESPWRLFGGIPLDKGLARARSRASAAARKVSQHTGSFGHPEGSRYVRLDINITQIARDLKLD